MVALLGLWMSVHSTTVPPVPLSVALASMLAACAMVTVVAW